MNCLICNNEGRKPRCMFCGKKAKKVPKSKLQKIKEAELKERVRLNQLAFTNFKKVNAAGSGVESFDDDVRATIGDWK